VLYQLYRSGVMKPTPKNRAQTLHLGSQALRALEEG